MASRRHLVAVNKMIKALPDAKEPHRAAFVELAQHLARSMDTKGTDATPALAAAYRSLLKDLDAALDEAGVSRKSGSKSGRDGVEDGQDQTVDSEAVDDIDAWRKAREQS